MQSQGVGIASSLVSNDTNPRHLLQPSATSYNGTPLATTEGTSATEWQGRRAAPPVNGNAVAPLPLSKQEADVYTQVLKSDLEGHYGFRKKSLKARHCEEERRRNRKIRRLLRFARNDDLRGLKSLKRMRQYLCVHRCLIKERGAVKGGGSLEYCTKGENRYIFRS